ncbi:uncharacterized protein LOC122250022 isoform X3 [Penaeus japonicus]|nr:uncharacterized protein LOC122250022 isoform X3 [Penaeus japonicus]
MITKLEARSQQVGSRNNQLERLQGLHRFLTTPVPRAPRMEMLEKMEAVIRNMHEKVQKATGKPEPGPPASSRPLSHGVSPGQGALSPNPSSSHRPVLSSNSNPGSGSSQMLGLNHGAGPSLNLNPNLSHNQGGGGIYDSGCNRAVSSSLKQQQGQSPSLGHSSGSRPPFGHGSSQQPRSFPARSGSEWQSSRDGGSERREKDRGRETEYGDRRDRGIEMSRESSYERNRGRDGDRSQSRHTDRGRDRDADRSRDRDSDRSRTKSYDRKREYDRHRDLDRSGSRDGRSRNSGDREHERGRERRGSSREQERDKNRETSRSLNSREREYDRERERDTHHVQRQRSLTEQEYQDDGKHSSKRNSLLDLPMPPSLSNTDVHTSARGTGSASPQNTEILRGSRGKFQKLFGDPPGPPEDESHSSGAVLDKRGLLRTPSGNWRDEVRARGDSFFSHKTSSDNPFPRHSGHGQEDATPKTSFQPNEVRDHSHSGSGSHYQEQVHWRVSSSQSSTSHSTGFPQTYPQRENKPDVPDTPMSPDETSSHGFFSTDTPQSPDMDASFSPVPSTDEATPVKTIPLESISQAGVDMENIKKALAQIRAQTSSSSGPSYRYEDFVGPAGKSNSEDEPYDPEEVWNNQDAEASKMQRTVVSTPQVPVISGPSDTDLRQIHRSLLPLPHTYQARSHGNENVKSGGKVGPQTSFIHKTPESGKITTDTIGSIPLPHRQGNSSQPLVSQGNHSVGTNLVGSSGAGFYKDTSNVRPMDPRCRESTGDIDMRISQPPLPKTQPALPRTQPPLPVSQPPPPLPKTLEPPASEGDVSLLKSSQPPLPSSPPLPVKAIQPPLPKTQPPLPKSPPPQSSSPFSSNLMTKDNADKEGQKRLDSIRARIAHGASEFIRPGQRGVAASQMEKYKLKRQLSGSRDVKAAHTSPSLTKDYSGKTDSQAKGKEPVSVLDILLPENSSEIESTEEVAKESQPIQDTTVRDPRFKPQQETQPSKDKITSISRARDPRLSTTTPSSVTRDPRQQMNRDPRQDTGLFPGRENRGDLNRFSPNVVRDPRQDSAKYASVATQPPRDPRQEAGRFPPGAATGTWDSRHESNQYPVPVSGIRGHSGFPNPPGTANRDLRLEPGHFTGIASAGPRDPRQEARTFPSVPLPQYRDPRMTARVERPPGSMWSQQPTPPAVAPVSFTPVPSSSGPVVNNDLVDPSPTQSASGSLIGQTFTCLMMRGLPPFVHSNHIYRFFQDYILRDMSLELDNHYNCKGTAYIHFPSHASAREALEQMNGQLLNGYPISLRICTVGILRQAKNMYEQLNRDREAQLGIPERPRGNGNPFFKPKPKEPKEPKEPATKIVTPTTNIPAPAITEKPSVADTQVSEPANSDNVGSNVQYSELCGVKVNPKTPAGKSSFKIPKIKKSAPEAKSSKSETTSNKEGNEKKTKEHAKKSVSQGKSTSKLVADDSSDSDELINRKALIKNKKNRKFKKIIIESDTDSDAEDTKKPSQKEPTKSGPSIKSHAHDEDDDDDECFMVIDETIVSDTEETEDSEVNSLTTDDSSGQLKSAKTKEQKQTKTKKSRGRAPKTKPKKKVVEAKKGKKKGQAKKDQAPRKGRGKKAVDKLLPENVFKPELDLHSSVGMKLTRQTQGELEELIKEKTKLKVVIPVPHRYVINIFDDDKLKKRGGRRQTVEVTPTVPVAPKDPEVPAVIEKKAKTTNVDKVVPDVTVTAEEPCTEQPEIFNYRLIKAKIFQKVLHVVGIPTARKGKKRTLSHAGNGSDSKRQKYGSSGLSKEQSKDNSNISKETGKRLRTTPSRVQPTKKSKLNSSAEKHTSPEAEGNWNKVLTTTDLFDSNTSSDDLPDLTQITPSLLDVDPTITSALPDATVLASVLSPPHVTSQTSEGSFLSGVDSDGDSSPGKLQIVESDLMSKDYQILDEIIRNDSKDKGKEESVDERNQNVEKKVDPKLSQDDAQNVCSGIEVDKISSSVQEKVGDMFDQIQKSSTIADTNSKIQDSSSSNMSLIKNVGEKEKDSLQISLSEGKHDVSLGHSEEIDEGDDTASVGMVSTSSLVDDASVISSEGRELKTPDSGTSKKTKRSKTVHIPPELRRVTRGSVVEPLTIEVIEWDDGGIVDLFQCDLCDYVGRHMAYHLVNFHTEREMPCEFKKEDFPPVIKDHVGPPTVPEDKKDFSLDLSWIPTSMTFEKSVTCNECDYISNSRFDLVYHVLEHKPMAAYCVYHCRLCNYMSECMEDFYNHVSSHTGEYRYRCDLCGERTYKKSLLLAHHKECHNNQLEKFSVSEMILDNGWPYIHVCKTCMFVRIAQKAAEDHVQHRHNGKADIHKANMTRPVILYSEQWKSKGEMENAGPRPKPRGRKRKKGKRSPDLEVFVGEGGEDEMEEEIEEKAKQLVNRIASNIHTTTSAEEAIRRMTLLNSISKKLDDEEEEEQEENTAKTGTSVQVTSGNTSPVPPSTSLESSVETEDDEFKDKDQQNTSESSPEETVNTASSENQQLSENNLLTGSAVERDGEDTMMEEDENLGNNSESDSESTVSALDPEILDQDLSSGKKGSLQDTIRKLSATLGEFAKEKQKPIEKEVKDPEVKEAQGKDPEVKETEEKELAQKIERRGSGDTHDSDSDVLVICEDDDAVGREEVPNSEQLSQLEEKSNQIENIENQTPTNAASVPTSTSEQQETKKMPKLRIRPAHQLLDMRYSSKEASSPSTKIFRCAVTSCGYNSIKHTDLIKHIISAHGPYKCIASGCTFVTQSRELFSVHLTTLHPKLNFLVCPFHCQNIFYKCSDLVDHLTLQHATVDMMNESSEAISREAETHRKDSDDPGFLRIESVATLDPTAASQMFGDDYKVPPEAAALGLPMKFTSPVGKEGKAIPGPASSSVASPYTPVSDKVIQTIQSTDNVDPPKVDPSSTSDLELDPPKADPSSTSGTGQNASASDQPQPPSETLSGPLKQTKLVAKPAIVTLDEDEDEGSEVCWNGRPQKPPPGLATLPRFPPTVPVPSVFEAYQPMNIFRILITKLAPEVFKCMYTGCVFVDDDPEAFQEHIELHGEIFRCCYCLIVMDSSKKLVQHVITEHSHCQFQCKYCLYRAFTKIYMGVHLKNFHPDVEPRYIKVGTIQSQHPPNPPIEQFVRPYKCNYKDCQYRTVDAEAFRTHVVSNHGQFAVLSCDFCHKHLHVQPLIYHMREHQMNEYQCPYCLHGDAEKERLLNHLLNCHPGRPGKVLLRKQITTSGVGGPNVNYAEISSPPPPPPSMLQDPSNKLDKKHTLKPDGKPLESKPDGAGSASPTPAAMKESPQSPWNVEGRRMSRSLSRELDSKMENAIKQGEGDGINRSSGSTSEESLTSPSTEKTGLSSHALYRCGNEGCEYSSATQVHLREHLQVCNFAQDSTVLKCHHCGKQCRHLSTLFEHLRVHGPKRYRCGVAGCDYKATMVHYFKNHMKQIHKCSGFKQILKDPKIKDPETQEYIVYPKDAVPPTKESHRKRKNEYAIEDIGRIPKAHVSYQDLKCYYCHFVSKVRLNLIKHIKLHEKYPDGIPKRLFVGDGTISPIPTKQPINPVPCLERKELMFDKMMNLAGSSFEAKKKKEDIDMRIKNPIPTEEYEKLPKYVPDERLHSCGIDGCNYLSCDDMMLKYHIRTLHADITSFPCPHCTEITITVEKISSHFKLHGDRLYRCGWCPYISYRRNVVERHMKEKHPTKKAFDFVIREPDEADGQKKQEEKVPEESAPPALPQVPQDPQWQCGLCKFCSVTQQEMVNHTSLKHAIKSQYKCGYCSVRSSVRASFDAHFAAKHLYQPFRVLCMYYRIDSEDIEPISQGNGQHSHEPLWKRNDPERIRHIRGILIDDDPETRKTLLKQTGTGKPDKGEFVCPMCRSFRTSCVATFRSHLCREADYLRYECVECGVSNALLPSLQRHYTKMHHKPFTQESYVNLPVEEEKENWVEGVISHQEQLIKVWLEKGGLESSEPMAAHQASPAKASTSRRSSGSSVSSAPSSEGSSQQGVVLHDSGSERGRFICDTCGSECRSAAGLKSHTTAMHQARFKCHYCPFASNTEDAVKQHCTVKHPKLQSEVIDVSQRLKPQKAEETEPVGVDTHVKEDSSSCTLPTKESEKVDAPDDSKQSESSEVSAELNKGSKPPEEKGKTEGDPPEVTKTHKCPFCPFTSNTTSGLGHHKRTKHADRRLFMCLHCNARFNNSFDVVRHNKWKHSHLKPQFTHLQEDHAGSETLKTEGDSTNVESSASSLPTVVKDPTPTSSVSGGSSPQWPPGPKSKKGKARKSFPNASLVKAAERAAAEAKADPVSAVSNSEPQVTYSCCHCNQQSSKIAMEEHMKKQHRDLPYQVRREEGDKVFTEVHVYKCIHCVVESISLAQAMDHWIQNHALLDFKFQMVLRHCGEVSNQIVTSTTEDPPQTPIVDEVKDSVTPEADTSASSAAGSSAIISSSSEDQSTKASKPLKVAKRRVSGKEMKSPLQSTLDSEDEEQSEASEVVDEPLVQTSSELDEEGYVFKCGLCKKSSAKLEELEAHFSKIHADRELTYKKMRKEAFEQIYRAEYECSHCGERGRHVVLKRHHKTAHQNLPLKVVRVNQNIYYRCDVCCHVVKNLQSMRYHIRRHHPEADEFTFSKLTLGSPVRPPMKQPFKCNYCGDVGETLQEMHTHHAFLHSHLECSITNLMDEALSSVHSPTPSHSSNEVKNPPLVPLPVISKCSSPQVADVSSPAAEIKSLVVPQMKNTARKSMTSMRKRHVAMKSTSKSQPRATTSSCSDDEGQSWYGVPQPSIQMENLYAFVNLGAGVPMRLTVQRLGKLLDLQPKVVIYNDQSE